MSEIQNTRDLVLMLRLVFTRAQLSTRLGAAEMTILRWEKKRRQGGTNARSHYRRAFNDAILAMVGMLEQHGIEIKDFPVPIIVPSAKPPGRDGRLLRLTKVELRNVLSGKRMKTKDVLRLIEERLGAKEGTVQAAARALGVVRSREGFGPGAVGFWELPVEQRDD